MVVGHLQYVTRLNLQTHVLCNFPHIPLNWLYRFCLPDFDFDKLTPYRPPFVLAYVLLDRRTASTMFTPLDAYPCDFVPLALIFPFGIAEIYWLTNCPPKRLVSIEKHFDRETWRFDFPKFGSVSNRWWCFA